jgi:hypothetical protein
MPKRIDGSCDDTRMSRQTAPGDLRRISRIFVKNVLLISLCVLECAISPGAQPETDRKPTAVPLFSNVEQGPAFMLECENATVAAIKALELISTMTVRVDGALYRQTSGIIASFLGGEPVFQPGEKWHMMVGLRQSLHGTASADFGARLRSPWAIPLNSGIHSIEFNCAGRWSDPVVFYWESTRIAQ